MAATTTATRTVGENCQGRSGSRNHGMGSLTPATCVPCSAARPQGAPSASGVTRAGADTGGRKPRQSRADCACRQQEAAVRGQPELATRLARPVLKSAVRAVISRNRLPQVVGPTRLDRLLGELRIVRGAGQIAVEERCQQSIAPNGGDCARADENLAT